MMGTRKVALTSSGANGVWDTLMMMALCRFSTEPKHLYDQLQKASLLSRRIYAEINRTGDLAPFLTSKTRVSLGQPLTSTISEVVCNI